MKLHKALSPVDNILSALCDDEKWNPYVSDIEQLSYYRCCL